MSQERSTLLDKMLGNGAAATLRGKANETKKKLDAVGLEHKEAKTKGMIDAIRAKVEAFVGQLMEGAPPELVDGIMAIFMQSAMEAPPAPEEPTVEEPPMEEMAEDVPVEDDDEEEMMAADEYTDEEDKAIAMKTVKLFDALIVDQAQITQDVMAISEAVKPVGDLVTQVATLTKQVAALTKQLSNRPRMASRAGETEIETDDLSPEISKHLVQKSKFWSANLAPE